MLFLLQSSRLTRLARPVPVDRSEWASLALDAFRMCWPLLS